MVRRILINNPCGFIITPITDVLARSEHGSFLSNERQQNDIGGPAAPRVYVC
jgi:hypothetical protein